ncbi:MAG: formate--tetrahydrofolate ligase [Bacillota bacterium]|nr:formate--tetrahydrofolate ligase [Bacillota bacterium]
MKQLSDIEIAQLHSPQPITKIAAKLDIPSEQLSLFGHAKAKLDPAPWLDGRLKPYSSDPRLILVTALSPTPAGEGKTTTTIGLADALSRAGHRTVVALREPSLGPVFGIKGGATGGGYAQVIPMEEINLHFTGDFHAIGSAVNLLAAMLDNHIQQGNALGIDPRRISWRRALDMNDRQLRQIVSGLGGRTNGQPREDGFDITVASEVMAVLCLAEDLMDLKERLGRMVVARTYANEPVTCADLKAQGAMTVLLREALNPNLVQTLEGSPALIHGGPFANIAHGANSIRATRLGLALADYCVTEAGFGADLGAEKFLDIVCRQTGLWPRAVVLVATLRALRSHGGLGKDAWPHPDPAAVALGLPNLLRHLDNLQSVYGLPVVVALNLFPNDDPAEIKLVQEAVTAAGSRLELSRVHAQGGAGATELAAAVVAACERESEPRFAYDLDLPLREKIRHIVQKVYRGRRVHFTVPAARLLERLEAEGHGALPVCMAKTQYSFSDDPTLLGAPEDFDITVREVRISAGAGFVVALTGDIMTMPGLPRVPAAERIDILADGTIVGLS